MVEFTSLDIDLDFENIMAFSYDFSPLRSIVQILIENQKSLIAQVSAHADIIENQGETIKAKEIESLSNKVQQSVQFHSQSNRRR